MSRKGCQWIWPGLGVVLLALAWPNPVLAAAPLNDDFVNATILAGKTNLTFSNVDATLEAGEPLHAGETALATVWFKWTAPTTGTFRVVTSNSVVSAQTGLDTVLAVYLGDTLSNLTAVVANDDTILGEFGALWSRVVFRAYAGETFRIAIGSLGNVGTVRLEIAEGGPQMVPWQAVGIDGRFLHSSNFTGQVFIIDFWETVCAACVEELPNLIRVQDEMRPRGFTFVGLSGDTKVQLVRDYLAMHPVNYPMAMSTVALQRDIAGVEVGYPTKLVIDQEGRKVAMYLGGGTESFYRGLIEPLLRSNSQDAPVGIKIAQTGSSVRLSWLATASGYVLQTTSELGGAWSDVTAEPETTESEVAVTLPGNGTNEFYRLIKR